VQIIYYDFKCEDCGCKVIEEVLSGVVKLSVIVDLKFDDDGELDIEYGGSKTFGGDSESIVYQCSKCGRVLTEDELKSVARK